MLRKILDIMSSSEDQPIEFDPRYKKHTEKKILERKKHYKDIDMYKSWQKDNKSAIDVLKKDSPKAMEYFYDRFTTDTIAEWIKKEKRAGKKIIGTFCNLVPEELIYAAGAIPIRLCSGHQDAIRPAEDSFPRDCCSLIKASFGQAVTDQPFMSLCDAVIVPATCDGKKKMAELLNDYVETWSLELPQTKDRDWSKRMWLSEMRIIKKRIEDLTGNKIRRKNLKDAILHLKKRYTVMRDMLNIRKGRSRLRGSDALIIVQSSFFSDVDEWIGHTDKVLEEVKDMDEIKGPRILLTGAPIILPNFKIPLLIEEFGGHIAIDETCSGSQYMYDPIEVDEWSFEEMMRAVGERYLMPSVCPCFIKSEDRIDKVTDMLNTYDIDGVIYHTLRLCLLFDIESRRIGDVMMDKKIPFLHLNTDYSKEDMGQLRTRIEAFLEIIRS